MFFQKVAQIPGMTIGQKRKLAQKNLLVLSILLNLFA